ncbi:MAG TPA: hypothetical protein VK581_10505 [Chthoniobacterales bacterium]|nr:hypothetical protein [Chthoniobacterales bacterium]
MENNYRKADGAVSTFLAILCLGSARVSRAGDDVSSSRTSIWGYGRGRVAGRKDRFGGTPKPTRETRALPGPNDVARYHGR